ncbi:helix-turn-helix transcriptional regulator [Veillonella sp.]|uniref:helix-turn-helix domain-containing protein n=1 Tax=Veillonella sp. TaxID=1926307 RepID=UPI0025E41E40|nr:helix-turn-helix transcriptional regulator [Veillonella sp.]
MKNKAIGPAWEDVEKQLYTPEEIGASDLRAAIMCELIDARNEKGISQKKLEVLSGVKQPVIARMEAGTTSPRLDTVLKVLAALGKTLKIVPINNQDGDSVNQTKTYQYDPKVLGVPKKSEGNTAEYNLDKK